MSLDEQLESELPIEIPEGLKRYHPRTLYLGLLYFFLLKSQREKSSIPWMSLGCRASKVPWQ